MLEPCEIDFVDLDHTKCVRMINAMNNCMFYIELNMKSMINLSLNLLHIFNSFMSAFFDVWTAPVDSYEKRLIRNRALGVHHRVRGFNLNRMLELRIQGV